MKLEITKTGSKVGFTLIELSIVMAIIGLIVAGIISGRQLVRQGQLLAMTRDIQRYQTAWRLFKSQYEAFPGDMANADSYWSGATNGNGNSDVDQADNDNPHEGYYAWQHLALSGLIPGTYTPTGPLSSYNHPKAAIEGNFFGINGKGSSGANRPYVHTLDIPTYMSAYPYADWNTPGLNALDTQAIDNKIDDGNAYFGNTVGSDAATISAGYCSTASTSYNITQAIATPQIKACWVQIRLD